jgi:hypothetical protein
MKLARLFAKSDRNRSSPATSNQNYVLRSYMRPDGSFDYERYRAIQEAGNRKKLEQSWADEENIACVAGYLKTRLPDIGFGICHGTRRGLEQQWFRERLGCEVIGTEIAETATQFPHTIQWDFHEVKPEWLGAADFIYSNAFDHSYDPALCINRWMSCLKPDGICVIEHSSAHEPGNTSDLDPFGASLAIMPYLILEWSKGRFHVEDIREAPVIKPRVEYIKFLMIRHARP